MRTTTRNYWALSIRGLWLSLLSGALCAAAEQRSPVVLLTAGASALTRGNHAEAQTNLEAAGAKLPQVADHILFAEARALVALGRKEEAVTRLERVINASPASPQKPWALVMAGELLLMSAKPQQAVDLIRPHSTALPAPKGWLVYGSNLEAAGKLPAAVMELQRVYYEYPRSEEAAQAETLLRKIKPVLGSAYPPALGKTMILRARKLMEGGDPRRALEELMGMEAHVGGADKEMVKVLVGGARYHLRDFRGTMVYLKGLAPQSADADSERIHYWFSAARRIDDSVEVRAALREFETRQPKSQRRLQALVDAANQPLTTNQVDVYEPLYRACHESFRGDPKAAFCHFRVAWAHYIQRRTDAAALLREHIETYPTSDDAAGAMYFLGRLSESTDPGAARAYYETVVKRFPNFYYALVATERLNEPRMRGVAASEAAVANLPVNPNAPKPDFQIDEPTRVRIERAKLLESAGLPDWGETELRFAAKADAKPHPVAVELNNVMTRAGRPDQGLRYVKSLTNGYLSWPFEQAPREYWKAAFPLPFQQQVDRHAAERGLDPNVVAGLIRQESEFDVKALSRSKAMGLTQIMPATGRELCQRLGIRGFYPAQLHTADLNLRLGSFYLRMLLDSMDRNWAAVLAAYNAGKSRADMWMKWGEFREPTEFIETIPFHETRNYVQVVLRNADMYRRIYGERKVTVAPVPKPVVQPKPAPAVPRRTPTRKK
ncbi:MAG: tetratricopeptide repeat protein [Acidobacteria bacterium]|nr:tetratricopeptide repeat protein [Acidobacteriota bacterium]